DDALAPLELALGPRAVRGRRGLGTISHCIRLLRRRHDVERGMRRTHENTLSDYPQGRRGYPPVTIAPCSSEFQGDFRYVVMLADWTRIGIRSTLRLTRRRRRGAWTSLRTRPRPSSETSPHRCSRGRRPSPGSMRTTRAGGPTNTASG